MKLNKNIIFSVLIWSILFLPQISSAKIKDCGNAGSGASQLKDLLNSVSNGIFVVGGVLVTISWVIAGILYLTSIGSQEKMTTAKRALFAAAIGTVVVVVAGAAFGAIEQLICG